MDRTPSKSEVPGVYDRNSSLGNFDKWNLSALNHYGVSAILLPQTASTNYSAGLKENKAKAATVAPNQPISSPSLEKLDTRTIKETEIPHSSSQVKQQVVIVLDQSSEHEKFTFGSSLQNYIVIRHPQSEIENGCYINLTHFELYPDGNTSSLTLCNTSTVIFTVNHLPQTNRSRIRSGQQKTLHSGVWQLHVGRNLEFLINVLPFNPGELYNGWLQISPMEKRLKVPDAKHNPPSPRRKRTHTDAPKEKKSERPDRVKDTQKKRETEIREVGSGSKSESGQALPEPRCAIGLTTFTEVFRVVRGEVVVAVKVCRNTDRKKAADMWRNEMSLLKQLDHPSVARLLNYNATLLSLDLEYVGPDLTHYADEQRLSHIAEETQYQIWIDVARGIEYIHSQNIIHRDIKPQNILLGPTCRAVICDFGISAKLYGAPENFNGGTSSYVPPEHIIDRPRGPAGDVYAYGITMLFVFRLIPLPQHNWKIAAINQDLEIRERMLDWVRHIQQILPTIPKRLYPLRTMLTQNPDERITAALLCKDLSLQHANCTLRQGRNLTL